MSLLKDEIEKTEAYVEAMKHIQPILDHEFDGVVGMGVCHSFWARKQQLLKQAGIDWKTPAEMNPDVIFD